MSRPTARIRIFIADDHPIVRQGLRRIVEADAGMVISGEADGAAALLAGLETSATDLVLLDVSMPGGLFLDTLRELRTRHPTIRVLALSVHPEDEWAVRALRAGASGYQIGRRTRGWSFRVRRTAPRRCSPGSRPAPPISCCWTYRCPADCFSTRCESCAPATRPFGSWP